MDLGMWVGEWRCLAWSVGMLWIDVGLSFIVYTYFETWREDVGGFCTYLLR